MSKHYPPTHNDRQFNCPYCNVFAGQDWTYITTSGRDDRTFSTQPICIVDATVEVSTCVRCKNPTFWLYKKIIYPPMHAAPPANNDLPDSVKAVYDEASAIANQSPRAASALLRLALQMLFEHLGRTGNLNSNIKKLVETGLDSQIQQALDIVRVTGNHAVHPGEIAFEDTTDVQALFDLVNIIAEDFITRRKRIQKLYDTLPEKDKKAIEKRDSKTQ